eukprot:9730173-Lingulodinium_polyedra.AAC.1
MSERLARLARAGSSGEHGGAAMASPFGRLRTEAAGRQATGREEVARGLPRDRSRDNSGR